MKQIERQESVALSRTILAEQQLETQRLREDAAQLQSWTPSALGDQESADEAAWRQARRGIEVSAKFGMSAPKRSAPAPAEEKRRARLAMSPLTS